NHTHKVHLDLYLASYLLRIKKLCSSIISLKLVIRDPEVWLLVLVTNAIYQLATVFICLNHTSENYNFRRDESIIRLYERFYSLELAKEKIPVNK
ncbi:MAG: hypothetical protein AAFX80_18670, partial [Cyanobacteria bacterium J06639_18]